MLTRLTGWLDKYACVGDVRGRGLMIAIELVRSKQTSEPVPALRDRVIQLAFERGLLLLGCGETSIRICPSLLLTQDEANTGLQILEQCIQLAESESV
jgi:4-aminobutyrate aminotransferase